MANYKNFDEDDGVWRTVGGRRIFIRNGQSLADAMKASGKFNNIKNKNAENKQNSIDKERTTEQINKEYEELSKKMQEDDYYYKPEDDRKLKALRAEYDTEVAKGQKDVNYELYKKAKENPDSKDPMTENSTDWQGLDEKYKEKYEKEKSYELDQSKISDAYKTYREKRDKLEGIETDELGNRIYETRKDANWTGKEYTIEEYLANLEDENWHTERKMILDAGLTNKQMEFVKDNTEFHNGSPNLDKEITEELIKGAKGEKFRSPKDIINERNNNEIKSLEKELNTISKYGKYDDKGNYRDDVKQDYRSYSEKKERYEQLTGKKYDDSNVEIPYDKNKTYEYPGSGIKINQELMKERYSGKNIEDIQNDIDLNKKMLMDYSPSQREIRNAEIKEMEKYRDSLPKYESRISDDFGVKDWKEGYSNQFGGNAWKGTKSDSGLHGKDKIKAIDDEIKKAYPGLKTSRTTGRGGYTDHFSYKILESDEPIVRNINDFSDTEIERLYNKGYNKNYYKTKDEFKDSIRKELEHGHFSINEYNIKDDYRLTPYGKQVFSDIMKVSNAYNFDESDSMTDYFHTGHYLDLSVGKDGTPYKTVAKEQKEANKNMTNYREEGNSIATALRQKGYEKYMKEHPGSKMTFEEYKKSHNK